MAVLAAPRLELRLRPAPRSRAGRRLHVEGVDATRVEQSYFENTNVLRTVFRARRASSSSSTSHRASTSTTASSSRRCSSGSCGRWPASPGARSLPADLRVRPRRDRPLAGVEPHRVHGLPDARSPHDERSAHVRRGRAAVPPRARPPPRPHLGRAARGRARGDRGALPRADARLLAPVGEGDARARGTTSTKSCARRSR